MAETATPTQNTEPSPEQAGRRRAARTAGLVVGAVIIVAALVAAVYGMVTHPAVTATVRDITIVVLALSTTLITVALLVLIFQLQSLIGLLRNEIKPILDSAGQTVRTVRGTTAFLSDSVVRPVMTVTSYAAGIRHAVRLLTRGRRRPSTSDRGESSQARRV